MDDHRQGMVKFQVPSTKVISVALVAVVLVGGLALALLSMSGTYASFGPANPGDVVINPGASAAQNAANAPNAIFGLNGALSGMGFGTAVTMTSTTSPVTTVIKQTGTATSPATGQASATNGSSTGGSFIQFFSNVTLQAADPSGAANRLIGLAYAEGGYVAYSSVGSGSAYVVIRVPASNFQDTLGKVQAVGNVTGSSTTSNDVTVRYTDLNATLQSLVAEQQSLLKLVNSSTTVNGTLAIFSQLQQVNAQINVVQSQLMQTKRLIEFSTISAFISKAAVKAPLTMALSATPKSGHSPLSVTFNAIVKGGVAPYYVNYNFGDGYSQQGQLVIHPFYNAGDYNVTATVTDSNGTVATAWSMVHVAAPPTQIGFGNFGSSIATLFINVLEGIAEVAVVVIPIGLVAAAVLVPIRRRSRAQKAVRQP